MPSLLPRMGICCIVGLLAAQAGTTLAAQTDDKAPVDYQREVRPILSRHCLACHGADPGSRKAELRLDTQETATAKLPSGAVAIVPGDTDASDLVFRITEDDDTVRMPPKKTGDRLKPEEIEILTRWVKQGAVYTKHWSFVPPVLVSPPPSPAGSRAHSFIDLWILEGLKRANLTQAPEADRPALLRRLSLDLRGLPPTPAEIDAFVHDTRPDAYERAVDRYLAEPAFGERWARMWLDLARYADSAGLGSDPLRPNMWRYRDWVIDAFNRNLPYDQFVIEQLGGDLLPNATLEQKVATAFHRQTMTNTEGGTDDEEFRSAAVKDRADTTGQVFMGLTFGCAKCHTHKYDPISIQEYYQIYAFFDQTADNDQPDESPTLPAPTANEALEIARAEAKIAALNRTLNRTTPELAASQAAWEAALGAPLQWQPLLVARAVGLNGTSYVSSENGLIQAIGPNPPQETIELEAEASAETITGLRLETVPSASNPNGGAGRASDGNFVLSRVSLAVEPISDETKLPLGRIVRIELPGESRLLSLAEVEVFSGAEIVGRSGEASQSSVDYSGTAQRAVDGNTNGNYFEANSVTHTRTEADPWWEVRLREPKPIDKIVVWNRTDGAIGSRLAGFRVSVLDDNRNVLWQSGPNDAPNPSLALSTTGRRAIPLAKAVADFSQAGFAVEQTVAGRINPSTGWAVAPQFSAPHSATFLTKEPATFEGRTRVIVTLDHQYERPGFTLGRFRLSITSDRQAPLRAGVPSEILAIIDTAAAERRADQKQALARYYRGIAPELQPIRDEIARLERSKPKPPPVPVMVELEGDKRRVTHILNKGNFLDPGETVEPRVLAAFHPFPAGAPANRLGLARWLVAEENPLTARVAVNRVWAQLFGTGLVETEEDFGTQGELPSHPKLLDALALWYENSNWDTKGLIRLIVESETYRQSSVATEAQLERDPRNRLLSRMPRVRLEAELVRDQALALSGLLARKLGGPSVYPPQPAGLWQAAFNGERTWTTSTGADRWRRGVYTFWRRTVPYPSMAAFDAPSRETCTVKRTRTNTPLQAFVTLNDPVYVEAAQALGRRLAREGGESIRARATFGLQLCLGRVPSDREVDVIVQLYQSELVRFQSDANAALSLATDPLGALRDGENAAEFAAWTSVANVLLNLDGVLTKG